MVNLISWPGTHAARQIESRDGSFSHFRNRSSRQGSNGRLVVDVNRSSGEREASASRFVVCDRLIYHSICLTHFFTFFSCRSLQVSGFLIISTSIDRRNL